MITQITSDGRTLKAKKGPITAADLGLDPAASRPGSLYVHVPFCVHKCHYCDFYSIVDTQDRGAAYVARLLDEARAAADRVGVLETIFVGGGTPTLLAPDQWRRIGRAFRETFERAEDLEFTVEANPETVDGALADALVEAGVNRASLGAQSFDPRHLVTLERRHDPARVAPAIDTLRRAGIDDVNLDLIFGIPGQDLDDWHRDLDAALALAPDHLSCYGLTYEPNTPLTMRLQRGDVEPCDDALEAAMYESTVERLAAAGFEHYEISNWARPGRRCRHNLVYWRDGAWWPLGPAAAGAAGGWRWRNRPRIDAWLASSGLPPIQDAECADDDGRAGEAFMLGLRLREGIAERDVERLLALGARGDERRAVLERACADGRLERAAGRLRFSRRGLLLADTVLRDLI